MILVVDMNYRKDSMGYYEFVLPIISVVETMESCIVKHYLDVTGEDLRQYKKIILSGTTLEDNVTLNQPEKFQWLKQIEKPVLGICAGMQTIGVVFNLNLLKCLEIGMTQITTTKENNLLPPIFNAYSLHNYSVEPQGDFEALAESATCIQAIKHKSKPIFGLLFHPEVRNEDILKRFVQLEN
jgi:GMP synthase-like glutamine amidotransferase